MLLRHVVLFRERADAPATRVHHMITQLSQLAELPSVAALAVGRDVSHRGEFTVGLTADFASLEDLRAYLDHPAHQEVVAALPQVFDTPWQVLDFWVPGEEVRTSGSGIDTDQGEQESAI